MQKPQQQAARTENENSVPGGHVRGPQIVEPTQEPTIVALERLEAAGLLVESLSMSRSGLADGRVLKSHIGLLEAFEDQDFVGSEDWGLVARAWGHPSRIVLVYGDRSMGCREFFKGVAYPWISASSGDSWWRASAHRRARSVVAKARAHWASSWARHGLKLGDRDSYWCRAINAKLLSLFWESLERELKGYNGAAITRSRAWLDELVGRLETGEMGATEPAETRTVVASSVEASRRALLFWAQHGSLRSMAAQIVRESRQVLDTGNVNRTRDSSGLGRELSHWLGWLDGGQATVVSVAGGSVRTGRKGPVTRLGQAVLGERAPTTESISSEDLAQLTGSVIMTRLAGVWEEAWGEGTATEGDYPLERVVHALLTEFSTQSDRVGRLLSGTLEGVESERDREQVIGFLRRLGLRPRAVAKGAGKYHLVGSRPANWEWIWHAWLLMERRLGKVICGKTDPEYRKVTKAFHPVVREIAAVYSQRFGMSVVATSTSGLSARSSETGTTRSLGHVVQFSDPVESSLSLTGEVLRVALREHVGRGLREVMGRTQAGRDAIVQAGAPILKLAEGPLSLVAGTARRPAFLEVIDRYRESLPVGHRNLTGAEWVRRWDESLRQLGAAGRLLKGGVVTRRGAAGAPPRRVGVIGDPRSLLLSETMADARLQATLVASAQAYLHGHGFAFSKEIPIGQVLSGGLVAPVDSPWVYDVLHSSHFANLREEVSDIMAGEPMSKKAISIELSSVLRDAVLASQLWGYCALLGDGALQYGFSPSTRATLRRGWLVWGELAQQLTIGEGRPYNPTAERIERMFAAERSEQRQCDAIFRQLMQPDILFARGCKPGISPDSLEKLPAAIEVAGMTLPLRMSVGQGCLPTLLFATPTAGTIQASARSSTWTSIGLMHGLEKSPRDCAALASVLSLFQSGHARHVRCLLLGHLLATGGQFNPAWLPLVPALAHDPQGYYNSICALDGASWGAAHAWWSFQRSPISGLFQLRAGQADHSSRYKFIVGRNDPTVKSGAAIRCWTKMVVNDPYRMAPPSFPLEGLVVATQAAAMVGRGLHPLTGESLIALEETGGTALPKGFCRLLWAPFFRGSILPEPQPLADTTAAGKPARCKFGLLHSNLISGLRALSAATAWM